MQDTHLCANLTLRLRAPLRARLDKVARSQRLSVTKSVATAIDEYCARFEAAVELSGDAA